jgi:hypothetical protein
MKQAVGFDVGEAMDVFKDLKNGFNNLFNNPLETLSKPGPFSPNPNIGFQPGENIIYQYSGGPGSTYGVGDTILYRYQRTSGDFDHQGHPLSFNSYFANQITTVGSSNISFFKDGQFDTSAGLDFLAGTVNENLFGGNNILGRDGLLFDDDFKFNSGGDILEGLGNQFFGEDTVNFVKDIFDGGGMGNPKPGIGEQISAGSYSIGGINTIGGLLSGYLVSDNIFFDGQPKPGFIGSKRSTTGDGLENKPDDVASIIESEKEPSEGIGRIVTFQNILNNTLDENVYKPSAKKMGEDGKTIEDLNTGYEHYYSKILNTPVDSDGGRSRNYRREERVNMGDPGAPPNSILVLGVPGNQIDKINALDIIENETGNPFQHIKYRDLVKFRFEVVNTDTPENFDVIAFRAFLDDFGDNYTANWNSFKYNGRAEEFYTYNSFKRTFSLSFKIAAQTRGEMMPLYRKLNYLISTMAGDYKNARLRGNFIKLTMGDYMDRVPGFLTSLDIKWQKEYPWEIRINQPETGDDTKILILPHVLDVSINFQPVHNFTPKKSITNSPFILPMDNSVWNSDDSKWKGTEEGQNFNDSSTTTAPNFITGQDFDPNANNVELAPGVFGPIEALAGGGDD